MLARAIFRVHDQGHRISFVSDSFAGLPPGDTKLDQSDTGYDGTRYLEVRITALKKLQPLL
jgi:hypothetical protein